MTTSFDTVFDVCVALVAGRILHASADLSGGDWGVINCSEALGAFDVRSDAWNGVDGVPHRFTREEAELRARRLSGSSWDGAAYAALEIPSKPVIATVGPIARAGMPGGSAFACIDWTTGPGEKVEACDDSAFGAAVAFVALIGHDAASKAVYPSEAA